MIIKVNGQVVTIKKNTSIDFISENSLFTGSDSYTLSISFPLRGCSQNIEVFGMISRKDVEKQSISMECEIRDKDFVKWGSITIIEIDELEVKAQFLEGRSEQNNDRSFDEIYLNELPLGYPSERRSTEYTPSSVWAAYPLRDCVALPWVNNTSGNLQNEPKFINGAWVWNGTQNLSFQPYLLYILKKVCQTQNYSYDFSEIENSECRHMVICNVLPSAWDALNFAIALPHWSLTEFFDELELFLFGEFYIDHRRKFIGFSFYKNDITQRAPVKIDNVINKYTAEISVDKDCDYFALKNIRYAENGNRYWAYRSCDWYIREHANEAVVFDTLSALLTFAQSLKESGVYTYQSGGRTMGKYVRGYEAGSDGHKLYYARDVNQYFIMFCYDATEVKTTNVRDEVHHWYKYYNRLEPINQFGALYYGKEADEVELKIVPAWIDDTDEDKGQCLFMECGDMGSKESWTEDVVESTGVYTPGFGGARTGNAIETDDTNYDDGELAQSNAGREIERGEKEKAVEYLDKLYIGYWDGVNRNNGLFPKPIIHTLETNNEFQRIDYPYGLSLNRVSSVIDRGIIPMIDGKKKYQFSWIGYSIPDVKAIFNIYGKKYMCEKITAQFTEDGMSQLLKGVFYRII